ncbi:hypothetical protein [Methylocaldum szegediense]|uniref:hypothetical protein n=1 Tax=Methylocaldum szegediense TaxID=73780 RepID=UPI0003FD290F|nr:hypothetical protein [Methylocaldum szegediense]
MLTQKQLKKFISRRHPEYEAMLPQWRFMEQTYEGGRGWFDDNIFRYHKEGDKEYPDRVKRAYRFNHTREVVDLVNKYIFRPKIVRDVANAPDIVNQFWANTGRGNGLPIDTFMRYASLKSSVLGRVYVVVDNNMPKTMALISRAEEKRLGARVYAYVVSPVDVLDMGFNDHDEFEWILLHETFRDDDDPFTSSGDLRSRYRLWTRTEWRLFEVQKNRLGKEIVVEVDNGINPTGVVPVLAHDHIDGIDNLYVAPSLIGDIAYLDRAVANYLSNLDAIIQDQTFSQLAMPAQGILPGDDAYNKLLEVGTKRIFIYDGENGAKPFFLSPDPRQAELIVTVIKQIINEIYHTVGMAGERTKQDNAVGIDNSSGVAKAYDFERINALLTSKAASLARLEHGMLRLVGRWNGINVDDDDFTPEKWVRYPETFDVRGLADEFDIALNLSMLNAPMGVKREQMQILVDKIFPKLKKDLREKLSVEIQNWDDAPEMPASGIEKLSEETT